MVIAFFALVAVANASMSAYSRLRVDIQGERAEVERAGREAELLASERQAVRSAGADGSG